MRVSPNQRLRNAHVDDTEAHILPKFPANVNSRGNSIVKVSFSSPFIVAAKRTHSFTFPHDQFRVLKELFPPPQIPDIYNISRHPPAWLCQLISMFSSHRTSPLACTCIVYYHGEFSSHLCYLRRVNCFWSTRIQSCISHLVTISPRCHGTEIK